MILSELRFSECNQSPANHFYDLLDHPRLIYGVRGFLDGYDPDTGAHLWLRHAIPAPGEKGHETWPNDSPAWENYPVDIDLKSIFKFCENAALSRKSESVRGAGGKKANLFLMLRPTPTTFKGAIRATVVGNSV